MFAKRQLHVEMEFVKWLVLFALAGLLVLAVASVAAADVPRNDVPLNKVPPQPLPSSILDEARPLPDTPAAPALAELPDRDETEAVADLWSVLEEHRRGKPETARAAWNRLQLPCENEAWRSIAIGVTYLQTGQVELAGESFDAVLGWEPENAVAHYYMAIYRLTQAQCADHWYDATGPASTRFAAWRPQDIVPNSKGMYELAAMMAFERAIELAPHVRLDQPLLQAPTAADDPFAPFYCASPTVGDLLKVLGADNFSGKAHHTLSVLHLDRGALALAEHHLDLAAETGLTILYGYSDLAERYEAEGLHRDALRAYLKAVGHGGQCVQPLQKALENFRRSLF